MVKAGGHGDIQRTLKSHVGSRKGFLEEEQCLQNSLSCISEDKEELAWQRAYQAEGAASDGWAPGGRGGREAGQGLIIVTTMRLYGDSLRVGQCLRAFLGLSSLVLITTPHAGAIGISFNG